MSSSTPELQEIPPLEPLDKISPSQFHWLKQCALRSLWSKTADPLLPTTPKSIVGNIAHHILEKVSNDTLDPRDEKAFRNSWESKVEKAEEKMASSWLSRRFVPLSESVPTLEVLYYQALQRAKELMEKKIQSTGSGFARAEVWVKSSEGDVVGRIDRVVDTGSGVILQDYKSGSIFESDTSSSEVPEIRESYATQMKLYAGLYYDTFSVWPQKLQLIGLNGTSHSVGFSNSESRKLLNDAKELLRSINRSVRNSRKGQSDLRMLASPSPQNCAFCSFRPACEAYWNARSKRGGLDEWPTDLRGIVTSQQSSPDGSYMLRVKVQGQAEEQILHSIRPNMVEDGKELEKRQFITVYNLFHRSEGVYTGTSFTTIYRPR